MKRISFNEPSFPPEKIEITKSYMKGWKYCVTYVYKGGIVRYEYVNAFEDLSVKELGE